MKHLILLLLIVLFTQCLSRNCEYYYYYSAMHERSLMADSTYKPRFVEGHRFTLQVDGKYLYEYKTLWPDAQEIYTGCADTLEITYKKIP
jgi:hypothetical protein